MSSSVDSAAETKVSFRCNICGKPASARREDLTREEPTCIHCRSSVRTRSIIHVLTTELFGRSLAIDDIPNSPGIAGLGLSDWDVYADRLAIKFDYINTYYHKEPRLDITRLEPKDEESRDFLISTEVFEHVAPPASAAFVNAFKLLKPGGLLVFTVPFQLDSDTIEHFPNLYKYEIVEEKGKRRLRNTTASGQLEVFDDLCFHGGDGSTLEMRIFSESGLRGELERAGFVDIKSHGDDELGFGIHWGNQWSLPISARKPGRRKAPPAAPAALELSILMPCLNEAETLGTCIGKANRWLSENAVAGEVVIADNGSTDGSQKIAADLGARVVAVPERGYGSALKAGIRSAFGRYIIMADSDDSYDLTNLMPFLEKLRDGNELVMGNRFQGGIKPGAMPPLHRYLGNPVLTMIGRLFFQAPCGDFHCGLRGFHKDSVLGLDLQTSGMEFASEMVIKARLNGLHIAEVPTTLSPDGRSRPPHLRSWRDGWRHLRFMLLYSPRWLFLYPGLLLMAIGMSVGARLVVGPIVIGGIVFDIQTLFIASAMVLIGFQSVLFAILAKTFAIRERILPPDPRMTRLYRFVNLERGLLAGGALVLMGLAGIAWAVVVWAHYSFGPLDPELTFRIVVPSGLSLIMGVQVILNSFFLSLLGL